MLPPRFRVVAVVGTVALTAVVHAANAGLPEAKLGLFYLVPVLVATWFLGLAWGAS